jgi:glycosyltransferase involved in cell wall biosynthesis
LISVIIPAYKAQDTILETLKSLVGQRHLGEVVICLNDSGETLAALDRLPEMVSQLPIRIEASLDRILPADENWTRACNLAKFPYTKLLCADDTLEPGSLQAQYNMITKSEEIAFVSGRRKIVHNSGVPTGITRGSRLNRQFGKFFVRNSVAITGGNLLGEPSAILFRTQDLKRNLPWNGTYPYAIDLDMYFRCLSHGKFAVHSPRIVSTFRLSRTSWSSSLASQQSSDLTAFLIDTSAPNYLIIICKITSSIAQIARKIFYTLESLSKS